MPAAPDPTPCACRLEERGLSRLKASADVQDYIKEKRGAGSLEASIARALEAEQREAERRERVAEAARQRAEEAAEREGRRAELLAR